MLVTALSPVIGYDKSVPKSRTSRFSAQLDVGPHRRR